MQRKRIYHNGFTLLELLISLTILLSIGSIVFSVLFVSIRSTTKINNMQLIRQSGNDIVAQLSRMIQFSQQFNGVSTTGGVYTTACQVPNSSGGSLQQYKYLQITSFDNGITTLSCSSGTPATIASNSASLVDTNLYVISNCNFTCTQVTANSPQTIGITFTISKKTTNNFIEDPAPLPFSTSVTLRNFNY